MARNYNSPRTVSVEVVTLAFAAEPTLHATVNVRFRHNRRGNFFAGGGGGEGAGKPFAQKKKSRRLPKFLRKSRKERRAVLQQRRPYWHMKVARYNCFQGQYQV